MNIAVGSAWVAGFALMTVELIATRIMAPYVGSSIYTWTSVIGVILLGMAIGNYIGGWYADKNGSRKTLAKLFALTSVVTFLIPLMSYFSPILALSKMPIAVITLLLAAVLFFVPAVCFGTLSPGIVKLHIRDIDATGVRSGQISAAWSLGSIVGTFFTGFYFTSYLGSTRTVLLAALILLANAIVLHKIKGRVLASIGMGFMVVGMLTYAMHLFVDVRGKVFAAESEYYTIRVVDGETQKKGRIRALFLDVDSHSIESLEGRTLNLYPDIYPVFGAMNDHIKDVLVLGGGSYALSKNIATFYKDADVTTVEIDPKVQQVAEDYFQLKEYPIRTEIADGRVFLQRTDKKYDLIFSDAYNSFVSVPWHMATVEFDREVRKHLNDEGLYAVNFSSARKGENAALFRSMEKTFGAVFKQYAVFAYGENEYDPQNVVLVGVNANEPMNSEEIRKRIAGGVNGEFLASRMSGGSAAYEESAPLLTDEHAPVERLMVPLMNEYFDGYMATYYKMLLNGVSK